MAAIVVLAACNKDEEETTNTGTANAGAYRTGVFMVNEGNFGANNASISYIQSDGSVQEDVFLDVNGRNLGDVLQSATWANGRVYAVLNNSGKVEVMNASTFSSVGVITGVDYPRYVVSNSTNFYISNGAMAGEVKVGSASGTSINASISVGNGPEEMAIQGNTLVVCNSGGWLRDSTLSVISVSTNTVTQTVEVSDRPREIVVDANGDYWVMCSGDNYYNSDFTAIETITPPVLHRVNGASLDVDFTYTIDVETETYHPKSIALSPDGRTLYFVNRNIYRMYIDGTTPELLIAGNFNTVDVAADGNLWLTSVSDFISPSTVYHYSNTGTLVRTYTAGMGSSAVVVR